MLNDVINRFVVKSNPDLKKTSPGFLCEVIKSKDETSRTPNSRVDDSYHTAGTGTSITRNFRRVQSGGTPDQPATNSIRRGAGYGAQGTVCTVLSDAPLLGRRTISCLGNGGGLTLRTPLYSYARGARGNRRTPNALLDRATTTQF